LIDVGNEAVVGLVVVVVVVVVVVDGVVGRETVNETAE
jgi:hypothetical protein